MIRLDKLNLAAESLRRVINPGSDTLLKRSIEEHGIYVPLIVSHLGKGEYVVWDGNRRVRILKEMGWAGSRELAAIVMEGGDKESVTAQFNINQIRERLSALAEAEAVRQLVIDQKTDKIEVGRLLLKSRTWINKSLRIWELPKFILDELYKGKLAVSHAMVISNYMDQPKIMNLLHEEAIKGDISHERLSALGVIAVNKGIAKARRYKPKRVKISDKSWFRGEPLQQGVRIELHLDAKENINLAVEKLREYLRQIA